LFPFSSLHHVNIISSQSIPSVPFLEKEFGCPGLHLPMGQSSDNAHLANERISLTGLRKGKGVVERFLGAVAGFVNEGK